MNHYPVWKNAILVLVLLVGAVFALPNLFPQDPVIEVSGSRQNSIDENLRQQLAGALKSAGIDYKSIAEEGDRLVVRFATSGAQLQANDIIGATVGGDFRYAMSLSPDLPGWLQALGAQPMFLGLDLRGGIHVLIDVDMEAAVSKALERYAGDFRTLMRKEKIRYVAVRQVPGQVEVRFLDLPVAQAAEALLSDEFPNLSLELEERAGEHWLRAGLSQRDQKEIQRFALQQNITTLRNRVNALGVAEPIIQQQGDRRIVVQLPGAQDPAKLKELLGATATLEYRLVDTEHSAMDAASGRVPAGSSLYRDRKGQPVLLKKRVIVTGDQITDAASGIDQQGGRPAVFVTLDARGARRMLDMTTENVGKPMAVVFIETRMVTRMQDGEPVKHKQKVEEVISVATIQEPFGRRFQTTGLDSTEEARDLALLLRAGALAAPIEIVEERTIGPSLGQDNIDQGFVSVVTGLLLVMVFMAFYYRLFGLIANVALVVNLILLVAALSLLQATLTLPGIAGIVLTVGMAVDANVLIFERIREEIRVGNTPQASISAGYDKALSTILDANITTLIAAVVLFSFGTGPIKGFAVTLFIGILSSMFTAIMGSRGLVNIIYGGKRVERLAIG